MQSTVAGKADAGTEITGGAFSNNTLSLTKAGGGSVDINFPEQNPTLKYYTLKSIANSMIIATSGVITEYGETVRADYIGDTLISAHDQGVFGTYGLYGVYVDGTETIQVSSTTTQSNKEILNDFTVDLPDSFQADIEDGKYKMPIDLIYTSSTLKTAIRLASAYNTIFDTEWIYFTVHNATATITNNPKQATLNKNHFCGEISSGNRIDINWDRIIKIG